MKLRGTDRRVGDYLFTTAYIVAVEQRVSKVSGSRKYLNT